MRKLLVLLRYFYTILCNTSLIKPCVLKEKFIKRHGKSYASHSITAPWSKQQSNTSLGGGRSQGAAARPSSSNAPSKMVVSTTSSPANQQRPATSAAAPTIASSDTTSSTYSREIVCHNCHGCGHFAAQCPSRRTMIMNDNGE